MMNWNNQILTEYVPILSAADVKMEIPVLVRSLKSSILSSTSFQKGKTFWGMVSAAVEQSRRKAKMVAQWDGKFGPWGWLQTCKCTDFEALKLGNGWSDNERISMQTFPRVHTLLIEEMLPGNSTFLTRHTPHNIFWFFWARFSLF